MCYFQRNNLEHINQNQAIINAVNVASINAVRQENEIEELLEKCFPAFVSYLYMTDGRECWPCFMEKGERLPYVVQVHDEYRFNHIQDLFVMVLENSNCENWIQIAENNPDLLTVLDFGTSPTRPRAYDNDTRDMCFFQRNTFEHINENQASLNAGNVASFNAVRRKGNRRIAGNMLSCFRLLPLYGCCNLCETSMH